MQPLISPVGYLLGDVTTSGSVETDCEAASGATESRPWRTGALWLGAVNVVLWGGALVLGLVVADTIPGWGFAPLALGFFLGLLCFGVLSAGRFARPRAVHQSSPDSAAADLLQRAAYCPADDCVFLVGQAHSYTRMEWRQLVAGAESGNLMTRTGDESAQTNAEEIF